MRAGGGAGDPAALSTWTAVGGRTVLPLTDRADVAQTAPPEPSWPLDVPAIWHDALQRLKTWARVNSPWLVHVNSGSCNGCDIEILATLTPRYDLERLGVKLQGSPRHADVLICTGPVTRQARERLRRVYDQMPEPKFVVAVGSCTIGGGVFAGCYGVIGHVDEVIPVDMYVPGCPPRPEAIADGVVKLLQQIKHPAPKPPLLERTDSRTDTDI